MAKSYTCSISGCKRSFRNHFALTAHLRFCKKGLTRARKGSIKCPECAQTCDSRGLGAHRRAKHGISGSSRWAIKYRKNKSASARRRSGAAVVGVSGNSSNAGGVTSAGGVMNTAIFKVDGLNGKSKELVDSLLAKVQEHRATAQEYLLKAERLEKLAGQLPEVL